MKRVLVVGSAEQSGGGVSSVIRLMKKMPVWQEYNCYWLGTQIQAGKWTKIRYALTAYLKAIFIIWRYDIVHFHTVPDFSSLLIQFPVLLLAKIGGKKVIMHLHVGNQLYDNTNNRFFKWWMRHSDLIILLAYKFMEIYKSLYADVKTPADVLYNACEKTESLPYDKHERTILFAGAFRPNKGGQILIRSFAHIHALYPEWRLVLLGSGIEENIYKKMICELGIEDAVEMPGYIGGDALKVYFKKAGIYCLCSYKEGFPMVVLEAWANAVPVVTTPVGGLVDVIEEGKNACTFDFGNELQLAEQLEALIQDYSKREFMSEYSKKFSQELFSLDVISNKMETIYQSL